MNKENTEPIRFNHSDIFYSSYYNNENQLLTSGINSPYESVIKIENTERLNQLFNSLSVYFDKDNTLADEEMHNTLNEAINLLLDTNPGLSACLFDFVKPWKVDILDFMIRNYMYDISMIDIAHFTGRSLAHFKRDFKKISELPPQKRLIDKMLGMAHDKIRYHHRKMCEVATEVGFRNTAHFSKVYKDKYGFAPTKQ